MIYKEDILKNEFEQGMIELENDYEGKAVATLIRRLAESLSDKAILYVHGFNDYFFQQEMAIKFNNNGYNFYALDLRKYGRSFLSHQKFNDIRNIKTYYEEIGKALAIIRNEGNNKIILMGHSTGGLILTLYAKDHANSNSFNGLILNSPFYEFNQSKLIRWIIPAVAFIGKYIPKLKISGGFSEKYGESIHQSHGGQWDYNLKWKPDIAPKINLGWLRAIYKAQKELKDKFVIHKPVLVLHSDKSVTNFDDKEQIKTRDAILNVNDIERIAHNIGGDLEIKSVRGGLHDLSLSDKPARDEFYSAILEWLKRK